MEFLAVFSTPQAWIELFTLMFLELALGIDNLVFIVITSERLDKDKQRLGRRLGLLGALCMRILLLCTISFLASITATLFTVPFIPGEAGEVTARDLIMLVGGIYLIYKGISELRSMITLEEEHAEATGNPKKHLTIPQAVGLIMVMDVVFSLDSVITAVGLVNDLPIMITAVICAVLLMIVFADVISNFIDKHSGIKILALCFILMVGFILTCEGFNLELDKTAVYYAMAFTLICQIIEIRWDYKGAVICSVVLLAASIVLALLVPVIKIYMGFVGVAASLIVLYLLSVYERNLAAFKEEHGDPAGAEETAIEF